MERLAQGALWVVQTINPERSGITHNTQNFSPSSIHVWDYAVLIQENKTPRTLGCEEIDQMHDFLF